LLQKGYELLQRAIAIAPANSNYATEAGYQLFLLGSHLPMQTIFFFCISLTKLSYSFVQSSGQVEEAMKTYKQASGLDDSNITALQGIIRCQLYLELYSDAEQQLEFLNEIQKHLGNVMCNSVNDISITLIL
jgi:tetratricopeptide (TPR) repeat protein